MSQAQIERWNRERDGPLDEEAFERRLSARGYAVTRYVYPPGTRFPLHRHEVDKIDVVLSGRFRMSIYGQTHVLEAGDSLAVPRGVEHSAEVIGYAPVVSLDAIKQP